MKRRLLACEVIRAELEEALKATDNEYDIVWVGEALHDKPEQLHKELVRIIEQSDAFDEIVISYGLCGNALIGIKAVHCDIIYPKTDDCISALMCTNKNLGELRRCSIFTSRGWLSASHSVSEYERTLEKYGKNRADMIYDMMFGNYKKLIYMQTEEEIDPENMKKAEKEAEIKKLKVEIEQASIDIYKKLLNTEEGEHIKRLKKGESITYDNFHKII